MDKAEYVPVYVCVRVYVLWKPFSHPAIISCQTGPTKPTQLDNEIHYDLRAKRTARQNKDMYTHTHTHRGSLV